MRYIGSRGNTSEPQTLSDRKEPIGRWKLPGLKIDFAIVFRYRLLPSRPTDNDAEIQPEKKLNIGF